MNQQICMQNELTVSSIHYVSLLLKSGRYKRDSVWFTRQSFVIDSSDKTQIRQSTLGTNQFDYGPNEQIQSTFAAPVADRHN
jgi:hypothetical protein